MSYPKTLYRFGRPELNDMMIVYNAETERIAQAEKFYPLGQSSPTIDLTVSEPPVKKMGRPRKEVPLPSYLTGESNVDSN